MLKRSVLEDNLREIFPEKDISSATITRIGGMSNMNYKVTIDGCSYVLRIPGIGAEGMVERANEEKNSIISGMMYINPPVLYFNAKTGVKLAEFIPNAETLSEVSIQQKNNLLQIAEIYSRLHRSRVRFRNGFNVFYEIEKYDKLIDCAGAKMYDKNNEIRQQVMAFEDILNEIGVDICACHNDGVPENFIKSMDGKIFLIDWEYSGMNDSMADLAALFLESNFTEENIELFLNVYFDGCIPPESRRKIFCYQILWDYLWAQWTVIKEAKGEDFGTYGCNRYNRAIENLMKYETVYSR